MLSPRGGRLTARALFQACQRGSLRQILERAAGPFADVDLVDGVVDLGLQLQPLADRRRRLARALEGAGVDRRDRLAREALGDASRLRPPRFAERHPRHAAAQDAIDQVVGGMSDEEEHGGHGFSVRRLGLAPMKRIVRSRASVSVNCSGGDFMK